MADKKPIRIYLAILNHGWIRREVVNRVLPQMRNTPGVEVVVENFNITWDHPIFSNRNKISRRFLDHRPKCDYMLQMDDDVIPLFNPAELVFANEDIIGAPAKVRQANQSVNWVAYVKHPIEDWYHPADFSTRDEKTGQRMYNFDLLEVDIVGTGLILVKRRVIEKLYKLADGDGQKAPFTIEVSPEGFCLYGTDFAFCRRAKAAGFKIQTTPSRVCEHIKEFGMLDAYGWDDSDYRDRSPGRYNIPWGNMAVTQRDWSFIKGIIEETDAKRILEFGAGLSSLLMSEIAEVTTLETDPIHAEKIENLAKRNGNKLKIIIWNGKRKPGILADKYDLVFVDGPLGSINGGLGRKDSIRIASKLSDRVIIHDAGRMDEWYYQRRYLKGKFEIEGINGPHISRAQYWIRRGLDPSINVKPLGGLPERRSLKAEK